MGHWVKTLAAMPDTLGSVPGTQTVAVRTGSHKLLYIPATACIHA